MTAIRLKIINKLNTIEDLPTLPSVMSKLAEAIEDINCSANDIVKILENDPAITTRLIKTVNSPIFSGKLSQAISIREAIVRLGFKEVKNIALSTAVFNTFSGCKNKLFNKKEFWRHSFATSLTAIEIGKSFKNPAKYRSDELHLCGLVHGIGKIILDSYFPELFEQAMTLAVKTNTPLYEAENVTMGINHSEVGAILAENWNLPPSAANTIKYINNPFEAPAEFIDTICVVKLAIYLVNTQGLGMDGDFNAPQLNRKVWEQLNISPDSIQKIIELVKEKVEAINDLL